ncbi:MAG: hypothetical protein ACTH30_13720 [Leucobacter sp.]
MNSNSNIDLQSNGTPKPRSRRSQLLLIAASIGAALTLTVGGLLATSGSASVVDSGFCVKTNGFEGEFTGERSYNCGAETFKMLPPAVAGTPACVLSPGLMGSDPRVSLRWSVPEEMKGYTSAQVQFGMVKDGVIGPIPSDLLQHASTTGDTSRYDSGFRAKPLSNGLLGQSWTYGVRFIDEKTGAASAWLTATAEMGNAGVNPTCTVGIA